MADVTHSIESRVATVTLSNPGRYNAMSLAMWTKLADTLAQLRNDTSVRAVILRGDGDKAFVSGADISEFDTQRNDPANVATYDAAVDRALSNCVLRLYFFSQFEDCSKLFKTPTVVEFPAREPPSEFR